ncbi:MAG: hypothetical protein KY475_16155 [Planctomycetes bacterium]|nr:hypothetical protein [Planctomycetota bacterium]
MKFRHLLMLLPALLLPAAANSAYAGGSCRGGYCHSAPYAQPAYCQPQYACSYVEKTVYAPQVVTEEREITVVRYEKQVHEREVTVQRCVATPRHVEKEYTVMVPYRVQKEGVRRVCRPVPVEHTFRVTVDRGHYETVCHQAPAYGCGYGGCYAGGCGYGGCAPRTYCCKKWIPNIVQEERSCMVLKPHYEDVPYTYYVTACRPVTKVARYTVMTYDYVPEQRTVQYCTVIPVREQKTVPVQVCRYVPKQVQVKVCHPVAAPCSTGGCYAGGCGY